MMKLYFAPMEGVTGCVFRSVHNRIFGGADKYFSPFIAPDGDGRFKASRLRDVLPENNRGLRLVPQVLANNAASFLAAARELADLGYEEINLNLGCPSATVVSKHKGAGMLADPGALDGFLSDVFAHAPVAVSVKTRLGLRSSAEFGAILAVYEKYPISELIVHARDREGFYKSQPDLDAFALALASRGDAIYNGNVFTRADYDAAVGRFPALGGVMLGRGAAADPALFRRISGGAGATVPELEEYHAALIDGYLSAGLSSQFACARMKELWFYMFEMFDYDRAQYKALMRSHDLGQLRESAQSVFSQCPLLPDSAFCGRTE